jgi:mitogen-activated protein kinase 1/3
LFRIGTSYLNQLDRIVAIIGKPDFDKLSYKIDDGLREYIGKFSDKQPENFYEIYKSHDKLAVDLLYKMLAFDPKERWTVDQCLHHQYFASFSKANLKACDVKFDWSFDEIAERNDVI